MIPRASSPSSPAAARACWKSYRSPTRRIFPSSSTLPRRPDRAPAWSTLARAASISWRRKPIRQLLRPRAAAARRGLPAPSRSWSWLPDVINSSRRTGWEDMEPEARISCRELLLAGAGAFALTTAARAGAASPPNIVFVMADDMGYADLSCYGRPDFTTPNIDRIAAGGVRLLQAYANSAVCSATRTALITGRYQYRLPLGLEEPLAGRDVGLPPEHPTLPSLLRAAGYATTLIGKWHLGELPKYGPLKSGYEHFYGFRGGSLDYYSHQSNAQRNDLWDDDVEGHQTGYLNEELGPPAGKH